MKDEKYERLQDSVIIESYLFMILATINIVMKFFPLLISLYFFVSIIMHLVFIIILFFTINGIKQQETYGGILGIINSFIMIISSIILILLSITIQLSIMYIALLFIGIVYLIENLVLIKYY